MTKTKIGFVGCGNIAKAIISGLILSGKSTPAQIFAVDPNKQSLESLLETHAGINVSENICNLAAKSDIIFLCVKPHLLSQVLREINQGHIGDDLALGSKVLISVCAGKTINDILKEFQSNKIHCIRVMPSLTLSICSGSWLYHQNPFASFSGNGCISSSEIVNILSSCGTVYEIGEEIFSHCTTVSGCGPGFFSNIAHHMIESAVSIGIPRDLSKKLVLETMYGTSKLLFEASLDPSALQSKVSTPGGSTQAGIDILENGKIGNLFRDCLKSTLEKCSELVKESIRIKSIQNHSRLTGKIANIRRTGKQRPSRETTPRVSQDAQK
ncbi:Pyrroline-5-carboxylate reductase [Cryptosporidium felis]|nr:Pyrroline-5-carboxylate reductase [Cryptosporidium felis]